MEDIVKQIALDVFGTNDGIRPRFPHREEGGKIQEAMEISFKAGEQSMLKEVVEWIKQNHWHSADGHLEGDGINDKQWQAKLKEWGTE